MNRRLPVLPRFQESAPEALGNQTLRRNLGRATATIRAKRSEVVGEMPDWEDLREAGRTLKQRTLRHLDAYLEQLAASFTGRPMPPRPIGSWSTSRAATARPRSSR